MTISVVVPLYNEEKSIPELYAAITEVLTPLQRQYEIVFVDDGSRDESFAVLRQIHQKNPRTVRIIRFNRNYGKSAALAVGIEHAQGEIIVTMDADLQDDPVAIPDMIALLEQGWDVVSGWKKKRHDPVSKTVPSKFWNLFTSCVSGLRLHDFNCGFKAYRANAAKSLEIYGERHRYLPALAHWDGYRVTEMVVPHHPRKYGKSKYGFIRFLNGLLDLVTLLFLRKYLKNPLHFFGFLGLLLGFAGSAVLAYFGVLWIITGAMRVRPLVLLSMGAIIMGIQFVSIGLIGEMIIHITPKNIYKIREELGPQ
jgi:glycosyltransferase involved in cell wall biosynthesis